MTGRPGMVTCGLLVTTPPHLLMPLVTIIGLVNDVTFEDGVIFIES